VTIRSENTFQINLIPVTHQAGSSVAQVREEIELVPKERQQENEE
jgi:hypothetical protein